MKFICPTLLFGENLLYLTIIICILAIAMSSYAGVLNFARLRHFAPNRLSGFISVMTICMVASILFQMLFPRSPYLMTVAQLYIALTIFVNELVFSLHADISPMGEKSADMAHICRPPYRGLPWWLSRSQPD